MEDSVGKKLSKARLKRGLTIDEAAHATRLRPDKIAALENDDYSLFASNVYAKGFLQIYGRFLDVDVTEFASTLTGNSAISIEDYQYLNSNAPARREERSSVPVSVPSRGGGMLGMVMFFLLLGGLGFGFYLYVTWQRVEVAARKDGAPATTTETAPAPEAAPANATASTAPAATPAAAATATTATPAPAVAAAATPAMRGGPSTPTVSDHDLVSPNAIPAAALPPPPTATNEVLVQPLRKTWVVVRKDDPQSAPIFEDYLYPDSPALKLKGSRFFIEARDPSAIQIQKNGAPMAYQAPGVAVQ